MASKFHLQPRDQLEIHRRYQYCTAICCQKCPLSPNESLSESLRAPLEQGQRLALPRFCVEPILTSPINDVQDKFSGGLILILKKEVFRTVSAERASGEESFLPA